MADSDNTTKVYGVYTHARPDGRIFYVGKGTRQRAHRNYRKNKAHIAIVSHYGWRYIIVNWIPCESEEAAFAEEIRLIKYYKDQGIKLTNRTDGGEGIRGEEITQELREAASKRFKGKKQSPELIAKRAAALKGRKIRQECIEKFKVTWRKNNSTPEKLAKQAHFKGRKHSEETKAKMSAVRQAKKFKHSPETCERFSEVHKGKIVSEETREKLRKINLGKKHSDETKEKLRILSTGKKLSQSARNALRKANLGKKHSPERIDKVRKANLGKIPWNKGKKIKKRIEEQMQFNF